MTPPLRSHSAVTLADVAREAGVSTATASFVLSGRDGSTSSGSPATKAKVRAAAERLGYVPNRSAQAMRTGRGGGIVLALGTLADPWGVALAREVRDSALEHSLSTLVLADERWYEYLSGASPDCAFITGVDFVDDGPAKVQRLASGLAGGLVAFSTLMEPESFDVIHSSAFPAIGKAYRKLRARHARVHFMARTPRDNPAGALAAPRTRTFLDAVAAAGDEPVEGLVCAAAPGTREAHHAALNWLSDTRRPTAVVVSTGYQAVALHMAASELGLRCPDDLEIISIGDVPEQSQLYGPISYYGVRDVFPRMADVIVSRATDRTGRPGQLYRFDWEFFPGATTAD